MREVTSEDLYKALQGMGPGRASLQGDNHDNHRYAVTTGEHGYAVTTCEPGHAVTPDRRGQIVLNRTESLQERGGAR